MAGNTPSPDTVDISRIQSLTSPMMSTQLVGPWCDLIRFGQGAIGLDNRAIKAVWRNETGDAQ